MSNKNNLVNRSEFARLLGCTPQAIMYAERAEMITKGRQDIDGKPMYNVKQAALEWSTYINPTLTNGALVDRLNELAGRVTQSAAIMRGITFDEEIEKILREPIEIPDYGEEIDRLINEPIEIPDFEMPDLDQLLSEPDI